MDVYVDTSVLGAYYCPEPLSLKADKVMQAITNPVISLLTEVEFFSLVAKKRRQRDFSEAKARKIQDEFLAHTANRYYRRIAISVDHYLKARPHERIRVEPPQPTVDAIRDATLYILV